MLLAACGTADPVEPETVPAPYPTEFAPELLGPMNALPACEVDPVADGGGDVEGLVLPDEATIVERRPNGPLTQITGWVDLTPVQFLDRYVRRDDLDIVQAEHEQFEAELLYDVGSGEDGRRVFIKTQVACATGSNIVAVVAPADDAASVPTPAGRQ